MGFELIRKLGSFQLELPTEITSWLLLIIYTGLILLALWQWRRNFIEFNRLQWIFFVITIVLIFPANLFFILYRSGAGIPLASRTGVGVLPYVPNVSLLGLALSGAAAYWLGPAPALLISLFSGVVGAWFSPLIPTDVLAVAIGSLLTISIVNSCCP